MNKIPVWIDTDCGVDDALALLVAMASEKIELCGISAVAGNASLEYTYKNARDIVHLAQKKIPVYQGYKNPLMRALYSATDVHGENGLGGIQLEESTAIHETPFATDALYNMACQKNKALEIVAIGPLTNIAATILKYPDLKDKIKRILFMGGAIIGGNVTSTAEFNAYADPEACEIVLNSGIPLVMVPLDCTLKVYFSIEELNALRFKNKVADFVVESSQGILSLYQKNIGHAHVVLHDTCPIIYLLHPELFEGKEVGVRCETRGKLTLGKTVCDMFTDSKFPNKNCFVLYHANREKILSIVEQKLESYSTMGI